MMKCFAEGKHHFQTERKHHFQTNEGTSIAYKNLFYRLKNINDYDFAIPDFLSFEIQNNTPS